MSCVCVYFSFIIKIVNKTRYIWYPLFLPRFSEVMATQKVMFQ